MPAPTPEEHLTHQLNAALNATLDEGVYGPQILGVVPKLNGSAVLEGLLRGFAQTVLAARAAYVEGTQGGADAAGDVHRAADHLAHTLLGGDPGYDGGDWFRAGAMGEALRKRWGLTCDPDETPLVLLLNFARGVIDTVDAGAAGALPSFLVAYRLDQSVRDLRDAFLGFDVAGNAAYLATQQAEAADRMAASFHADRKEAEADLPVPVFG